MNGDGFPDVAVSAPTQSNGAAAEGNVFVFYGSAAGIPTSPSLTLDHPNNEPSAGLGGSLSGADVNGDGYSDLVAGCNGCNTSFDNVGKAFLYYGTPAGIPAEPSFTFENPVDEVHAWFGISVHAADLNADGFGDICIGASVQNNGAIDEGNAFIYYGTASGTTPSPVFDNPANQANGFLGISVAIVGDANGDGFGEVVLGAHGQDAGAADEGNAFVYYSTAAGAPNTPSLTLDNPTNQMDGAFGVSVLR